MLLTVAAYDRAETEAEVYLPNRVIQCCRPELFAAVGYPTRIDDDRAVFRFADAMHLCRFDRDFPAFLGALTEEEFDLFRRVSEAACRVSLERSGRTIIPKGGLLRAMVVYRHIRMLLRNGSGTVVDVGSGSGYLTALLALAGYSVFSTDVSQGFYLWQSALLQHLVGDRFRELAADARELSDFVEHEAGAVVHVPWWKFVVLEPKRLRLAVDIVSANHMLCEMHADALLYLVRLCRQWFERSNTGRAAFVFEGYGSTLRRSIEEVNRVFHDQGLSYAFRDQTIQVMALGSADTALSRRIADEIATERETLEGSKRIGFAEVRAFQEGLAGSNGVWSDDEKFWRYLYGPEHYG